MLQVFGLRLARTRLCLRTSIWSCKQNGKEIIARQQLQPIYSRNGIAYAIKRKTLLTDKLLMGKNSGALICKGYSISIDSELDLELANYFLQRVQKRISSK